MSEELNPPPSIEVRVVDDTSATARCDRGFLRLRRLRLQNVYPDGATSEPYAYDLVERDALDAIAIVLWARDAQGRPTMCLRSSLRPPLAFRPSYDLPIADPIGRPTLWEVPAGLVEIDEKGEEGLRRCAVRETLEEVGLTVAADAFERLGPAVYLSPGVMAEQLHYLVAAVDPSARGVPTEDGSPVEERALVVFVPLEDALHACRDGRVNDIKTETAIRRLAERVLADEEPA